ncbi:Pr6Pr family membrane protein [Nocardia sp. NBC_01329]|uniref:Pr6Pr family membrane protein n=1 Tax=Nocardia sp. NBC_01329 TaxID=2903594 RepID=UPI002E0F4BE3|nr:Pr6Pr family membrane protein [Nocardia sp. NBC_01329]
MNVRTRSTGRSGAVDITARVCHLVITLVIAAALVTQLILLFTGGADANSGRADPDAGIATRLVRLFSYFTIQSNLFVLAASVGLAIRPDRDGRLWRVVRLDALLGIAITGLVFALVLADEVHLTGAAWWANLGFHYIAPWATLAVWLVFGPRPRIDRATIAAAFVWPVAWIGYTFAHGAVTDWYPYPFLDVARDGYATALVNTLLVIVLAVVLVAVFALLDRLPTAASGTEPDIARDAAIRPGSPGRTEERPGPPPGAAPTPRR